MNNNFSEYDYPAFSGFRKLMDCWDHFTENEKSISDILDKNELMLFFTKGKEIFGAPEDSRVIFAKLKTDTEDDPMMPGFRQEAQFSAVKLLKLISGNEEDSNESVFGIKDLPNIKVCSREDAIEKISKKTKKK